MKKENLETNSLKEKLSRGLDLTFEKLLKKKKAENGVFVFGENGKIKKVKALDIK
jgi:hypothetical protein